MSESKPECTCYLVTGEHAVRVEVISACPMHGHPPLLADVVNETKTLTISEFLRERLREREQFITRWQAKLDADIPIPAVVIGGLVDPQEALEDIMSKRAIVDQLVSCCWQRVRSSDGVSYEPCGQCDRIGCRTLRLLAAPYRRHESYREEWA